MDYSPKCENGCKARAVWKCEHLFFCEACKEDMILRVGVDRFTWERLDAPEEAFDVPARRESRLVALRRRMSEAPRSRRIDENGIKRIPDRTNPRGSREICTTFASWEKRRKEVAERAGYRCEECGAEAPLHNVLIEHGKGILPSILRAGEADHIRLRKRGSAERDDHESNLRWLCWLCHRLEHAGKLRKLFTESEAA